MVEGSRCFASGELSGAAAAGPAGSTGSSSMTRRCIFVVVSALLVVIFVKEGCLLLFLLLPRYFKGLLFQDLPRLFNIFQNLSKSFFHEGRWPSLLASSKIFQGLPFSRCSKIFQNLPEFSERLLLPKSPESFQPLFLLPRFPKASFRSFPDFPEVFWDSPGVFHWLSNTLYTGNRWRGQFWFPVLIHTAAASACIPCAFGWYRLY